MISGIVELLRIRGGLRLPIADKYLKAKEKDTPSGAFFFLLSSLITMLVFKERAAIPSLFVLSISDPLSSLTGYWFGKRPLLGKTLEGSMIFFISSFFILIGFSFAIPVVLITALVSTATELVSSRYIDDNLSIPIMTALALSVLPLYVS